MAPPGQQHPPRERLFPPVGRRGAMPVLSALALALGTAPVVAVVVTSGKGGGDQGLPPAAGGHGEEQGHRPPPSAVGQLLTPAGPCSRQDPARKWGSPWGEPGAASSLLPAQGNPLPFSPASLLRTTPACPHEWAGHCRVCCCLSVERRSWEQGRERCSALGAPLAALREKRELGSEGLV